MSQNNKFLLTIRKVITNEVLENKTRAKKRQQKELAKLQDVLVFILTQDEWDKLQKFVNEKKAKIRETTEKIHQKKSSN